MRRDPFVLRKPQEAPRAVQAGMVAGMAFDPARSGSVEATRPSKRRGWHEDDSPKSRTTFSDPGVRVWDGATRCWVLPPKPIEPPPRPQGRSAIPVLDGSGVFWTITDRSGRRLWTIEAWDWEAAQDEKRRLAAVVGARAGWLRVYRGV